MNGRRDAITERIHVREMRGGDVELGTPVFPEDPFAIYPGGGVVYTTDPRTARLHERADIDDVADGDLADPYGGYDNIINGVPCERWCERESGSGTGSPYGAMRWGRSPFDTDAIEAICGE